MIANTITQKIGEALKAHDELRLSTLRMLSSAFNYEKIAKQHELSDEEEFAVIRKEVKKRNDTVESLKNARGKVSSSTPEELEEKIKKEEEEIAILKDFLPQEMEEVELEKLIEQAINEADLPADATHQALQAGMGKVIGMVKQKSGGRAEGGKIAEMVKAKLNSQ